MRNDLIRAVLDCGVDDLSMLDDSGADMFKVVEQMRFEGLEITLNGIMAEIFREGIFRMSEAVKETRKRLEDEEDAGTLTEAGYEQLGAIRQHDLNPQSDFTYYVRKFSSRKCRTYQIIPASISKGRWRGYGLYGRWVQWL